MPGARRKILGHVMSDLCVKMNRRKQMPSDSMDTPLKRCLSTLDITLLGVGNMVGAGVFVLTGTVAKDIAGPGIILSFILAGFVSLLAALCYAEFAARIPRAGSAYCYSYTSIGEFWAFLIGWNIILEHMLGAASVSRAWSGYVNSMFSNVITNATIELTGELHEELLAKYPDFLAFFICILYCGALGLGVKTTAILNGVLTSVNLMVMLFIVCFGLYFADLKNWSGSKFLPYGVTGVLSGAGTCFYAFCGFDSIATSAEEAKTPQKSIPFATIFSLLIVTLGYVLVSGTLTLMVPLSEIHPTAALSEAFGYLNIEWAKYLIAIGALCGMTTTLLGSLYALPRCLYAMASDGLLFSYFARVNETTQIPLFNLAISGFFSALLALIFDLEKLVEFMSIGTLLAYTIVSASVLVLRYRPVAMDDILIVPDTPGHDDEEKFAYSSSSSGESSLEDVSPTSEAYETSLIGRLRPQYRFLEPLFGKLVPGSACSVAISLFSVLSFVLCLQLAVSFNDLVNGSWWALSVYGFLIFCLVACVIVLAAHHQNTRGLPFKVWCPYIPILSILCNIELMIHLNILTWIRFFIWIALGMLVYFLYGIHHSKQGEYLSTSYSLMTSSEATKKHFGSTGAIIGGGGQKKITKIVRGNVSGMSLSKSHKHEDKKPIIDDDEDNDD